MDHNYPFLSCEAALREFVTQWESYALPKEQWTHGAHVATCAYYTAVYGAANALRRMQQGIPVYNEAMGGKNTEDSGYHETLTRFWAKMVAEFIGERTFATPFAAVEATVHRYGQERKLHEAYYSFDVVADRRARREWVAPDKLP